MVLQIYVAKDAAGQPWPPDYPHEVRAALEMLRQAWASYHYLPELYAVFANMRQPSADMVVMTERGVGIVELKHHSGKITCRQNGLWYAGAIPISGGNNHSTPHKQVQSYGEEIRGKVLSPIVPHQLQARPRDDIKFQTAVCFTNPDADIVEFQTFIKKRRNITLQPWESNFEVISPSDFVSWIASLRFIQNFGARNQFEPMRLKASTIEWCMKKTLGGIIWEEAVSQMPDSAPYAFLHLVDEPQLMPFKLTKDVVVIGRDPDCDIRIPSRFTKISRKHCQIIRKIQGYELKDLGSSNGTFYNGKKLEVPVELKSNHPFILGDIDTEHGGCTLILKERDREELKVSATKFDDPSGLILGGDHG